MHLPSVVFGAGVPCGSHRLRGRTPAPARWLTASSLGSQCRWGQGQGLPPPGAWPQVSKARSPLDAPEQQHHAEQAVPRGGCQQEPHPTPTSPWAWMPWARQRTDGKGRTLHSTGQHPQTSHTPLAPRGRLALRPGHRACPGDPCPGPAPSPAIYADLGHPQERGASGGASWDSPRTELGSCQALSVISKPSPLPPTSGLSVSPYPEDCGPGWLGQEA